MTNTALTSDDGHELFKCPYGYNSEAKAWWKRMRAFKDGIRYVDYSAHFTYGMPQSICPKGDPTKEISRTKEAEGICCNRRSHAVWISGSVFWLNNIIATIGNNVCRY
jgi:hypothetical protein